MRRMRWSIALLGAAIAGSAWPGGQAQAAPAEPVGFDIVLPLRDEAGLASLVAAQQQPGSAQYHHWLTPAEIEARFGPDPALVHRLAGSLRARGVTVAEQGRILHVSGDTASVQAMLSTHLAQTGAANGARRTLATGPVSAPDEVRAAGGVVLGFGPAALDGRAGAQEAAPANRNGPTGRYWYDDLRQAYAYPAYTTMVTAHDGTRRRLDGSGATIGLLMSSDALDSDVAAMFAHENWTRTTGQPTPTIFRHVAIDGGCQPFGAPDCESSESSLDVQQAIGGAPGAHVIMYNLPSLSADDLTRGMLAVVEANEADVVSMSIVGCELAYTADYAGEDRTGELRLRHQILEQGNAQGMTFIASSGDNSGLQCPSRGYATQGLAGTFVPSVSFPADDPAVTAVGGTNLVTQASAGSVDSTYVSENAWSDPDAPYDPWGEGAMVSGGRWGAGGGVSAVFARPLWQFLTRTGSTTMRTVPDIGMEVGGCPSANAIKPCDGGNSPLNGSGNTQRSSVAVLVGGQIRSLIGTSVAAPEFASVVALAVERFGRLGNINPWLYGLGTLQSLTHDAPFLPSTVYRRGIPGYNGVVGNDRPGPGYNATVGNGTPLVARLLGLPFAQTAGTPQTATNP